MVKIATEKEAYDIGKHGTPEENKCCTMSKAKEFGCKVIDEYESNQLVCKDSLIGNLYLEIDIFLNDGSYVMGDEGYGFYSKDTNNSSDRGSITYNEIEKCPPLYQLQIIGVEGLCKPTLTITESYLYVDTHEDIRLDNLFPIFGRTCEFDTNSGSYHIGSSYDNMWDYSNKIDNESECERWVNFWRNEITKLDYSNSVQLYWEIHCD